MESHVKDTLVAAYSLDGKLIKIYPSCKYAANSIHVFSRAIDKAVREGNIIHEKQWKRVDKNNVPLTIPPYIKKTTFLSIRPIAWIDESNKVIKTYPSIKSAAKENKVDPHTLRDVLSGKTKLAKGKKYRYLTDSEIKKYGYQKGESRNSKVNPVVQYSLDGKYIKTYKSIHAATLALGKKATNQGIRECLNGKYSTAFGYKWKYKERSNVKRARKHLIYQLDKVSLEVIHKFISVKEASLSTLISISSINNCIRGRQSTAGGYIWIRK